VDKIKVWLIDSVYAVYGFILMYLFWNPPRIYIKNSNSGKCPIIILPGYLVKWGFMKKIADEISSLGHPVYVIKELGNNIKDVAISAKIVSDFISKNKLKDVVIIGRSKGGLIGKYNLVHFNKENNVKGLIAIATPFHGSKLANFYKFIKSNEFSPDHPTIRELTMHPGVNKKIITINPSSDNIVLSEKSTELDGALENIEVKVAGHHRIVFDKVTIKEIKSSIKKFNP
jgi:triacylglycerol lipase